MTLSRRRFHRAGTAGGMLTHQDRQSVICKDTETYTKWARDTYASEKALIERLGMANKS